MRWAGVVGLLAVSTTLAQVPAPRAEWPIYGGSLASDRYSPLTEITPDNVARLEEAGRFDTGETGGFHVNPIVVDGVIYSPTPLHRVVALDAATGAHRWTFDPGIESRGPNRGVVFWKDGVLEQETGRPDFPIEERPFPASTVPGEKTSRTQPVPRLPEPFARQRLTSDLLTRRTPAAHRRIFVNANDLAWTGALAPDDGGSDGRSVYLKSCATCHRDDRRGTPPSIPALTNVTASAEQLTIVIRQGVGRMPGFANLSPEAVRALVAYLRDTPGHGEEPAPATAPGGPTSRLRFTGYKKFLDPDGNPAVAPPWGTLTAIDLDTGRFAWRIPLGEYPELAAQGLAETGTENYGGPIVTAGGVLFIGATNFDRKFRAFEAATGRLRWQITLPFAANTTPATYEAGGRQYVLVAAGGGKSREPSGGMFIAYRLAREEQR